MVKFPQELKIKNIENILIEILQKEDDLIIPISTKGAFWGGLAAAIQCINTWAKVYPKKTLRFTKSRKQFAEQLRVIIEQPYKFSGALMSKNLVFISGIEEDDIKRDLYAVAKTMIEKQSDNQYGLQRGGLCWFSFVDHSTKGFDRNFYTREFGGKPILRQDQQIENIIHAMIQKSFRTTGGSAPLLDEDYEIIGRIFSELFKNTHEHGSRRINRDEWLRPAVRTIYAKAINLDEIGAENMVAGDEAIVNYMSSLGKYNLERCRFLELGIVDSGLGYCDRWLADHQSNNNSLSINIDETYNIFKKCFSFRSTSSKEDYKGMGLPVVMKRLSQLNGFMKVRSGRLSLYRDFKNQPYNLGDDCGFYDWNTQSEASSNLTEMSNVVGVAITLLIPLGDK